MFDPAPIKRILHTLALWASRARERSRLSELDDYQLADIGITRDMALTEASRAPWSGSDRPENALLQTWPRYPGHPQVPEVARIAFSGRSALAGRRRLRL